MVTPGPAILIVDDDADIREALTDVLADYGYQPHAVANGREALDALQAGALPAVILLDLMMPVMDGAQFRREQLHDPRIAAVPVIVISAGNDVQQAAQSLGVADTMNKPIDLQQLLARISSHLPS